MYCLVMSCFVMSCGAIFCLVLCSDVLFANRHKKGLEMFCHKLLCSILRYPYLFNFEITYRASKPSSVPTGLFIYSIKSKMSFNSFSILYLFLNACSSEYARFKSALYSSGLFIIRLIDL